MKNKQNLKGFTIIELLAVIIILAVIALIATPIVLNVVDKAKESSRQSSVAGYADATRLAVIDSMFGGTTPKVDKDWAEKNVKKQGQDVICEEVLYSDIYGVVLHNCEVDKVKPYYFASGKVYKDGNDITYKTIYDSIKNGSVVSNYKDAILNGSDPELDEGMIPVYYEGNTLKKADISKEWYNYTNKNWANVVLVNDATIKDLPANTVIDESKILAYFVWIPRYKYAVPTGTGPRSISIVFENKTTSKSNGDATGTNYLTHPAFTFGTTELNGIWVGKFETAGDGTNPTVKPNVTSLIGQTVSTQFVTAQKFGTSSYGVSGVDAHMMKNSEWGATAYLSHSIYGINKEVRINNNAGKTTGCGALSDNASQVSTCDIKYGNASDLIYPQSTTGNITGIYDMSGGAWEYVMGNYNSTILNAGFSAMPETKYFDLYITSTGIKGDATNADGTSGWYGDGASFVGVSSPWFIRGGNCNNGIGAGAFSFFNYNGNGSYTFRPVLSRP